MTELSELGLERDAILNGDIAEYTPVDRKIRRDKNQELYLASVVDKVTKAVFADLKTAYEQNDQLSAQVNRLMNSVNKQQDYERQLQSSESKLNTLSQEMNRVQQMSAKLHTQLANAQKASDEATKRQKQIEEQLKKSKTDVESLTKSNTESEAKLAEAKKQLVEANNQLDEAHQNLTDMDAKQAEMAEGLNKVIKSLTDKYGAFLKALADESANDDKTENQE